MAEEKHTDTYRELPLFPTTTLDDGFEDETFRSLDITRAVDGAGSFGYGTEDVFRSMDMPPTLFAGQDTFTGPPKLQKDVTPLSGDVEPDVERIEVTAPQLPPSPFFLEANSHFYMMMDATSAVQYVATALARHHVDLKFKPLKCKWRASSYANCYALDMRVQLYCVKGELHAVDVQRRDGNVLEFQKLYSRVVAELIRAGVVTDELGAAVTEVPKRRASLRPLPRLPIPSLGGAANSPVEESAEGDDAAFGPLLGMMETPFVDIQLEAVRSVASLAATDDTWPLFVANKRIVERLVELTRSGDVNVRRCAVTALSSLTRSSDLRGSIVENGGIEAMTALAAPSQLKPASDGCVGVGALGDLNSLALGEDLGLLEVMRHSVAALANLAAASSHRERVNECCGQSLVRLTASPDATLRTHAVRATESLRQATC